MTPAEEKLFVAFEEWKSSVTVLPESREDISKEALDKWADGVRDKCTFIWRQHWLCLFMKEYEQMLKQQTMWDFMLDRIPNGFRYT